MNKSIASILVLAILGGAATFGAVMLDEGHDKAKPAAASSQDNSQVQIAASGIVEASTGTIAVGTPVAGIVSRLDVSWGDHVTSGQMLFHIDDRDIADTRSTAVAQLVSARAALPPAKHNLDAANRLRADGFVTKQDLVQRRADYDAAQAAVAATRAQVTRIDTEIARRTVRAPISGRILKINVRRGEFADTMTGAAPVILMGGDDPLYVRADVDEHDAWRVKPGVSATAFVPGNHALRAPLSFVRIEPFVQPKTNLTGSPTQRTDTRVLQVIYSFRPQALPVYIGQQVDVVIGGSGVSPSRPARP
jgi:HlyD family secretion protein